MRPLTYHDKTTSLQPFKACNKFAIDEAGGRLYVVYSYGEHWPMYLYDRRTKLWYENCESDSRSQSTRRHAQVCRPQVQSTKLVDTGTLHYFIDHTVREDRRLQADLDDLLVAV